MRATPFRTVVLILVIAAASLVGGYVYVVCQRSGGGVTNLGEDTIGLVYGSLFLLLFPARRTTL